MAGNKSNYVAGAPLSEQERAAIGDARDLLKRYGLYVDVAEMSDVAYEQRNCRMKSLDLATHLWATVPENWLTQQVVKTADMFYDYIWNAETHEVAEGNDAPF